MKILKLLGLLCIVIITMNSCKKNNDTDTTNWAAELKGSVWAGEFNYSIGIYQGLQPFSIVFSNDSTLTWSDIDGERPGGTWKTEGNKIILNFPNGTSLSATISKESWSNFLNITANNGFTINNLSRAVLTNAALLDNTIWKGKFANNVAITFKFLPTYKVNLLYATNDYTMGYMPSIAGVRIPNFYPLSSPSNGYLAFFKNATELKGYMYYGSPAQHFLMSAVKQ